WLTCYACSPMPSVILEYRNGRFRPNFALMKKDPPTMESLRQQAQEESSWIGSGPEFTEESENDFSGAFWGEILTLLYTGNEQQAWQYLDLVWPSGRKGKETFKKEFLEQLNSSLFWTMIQEDLRKQKK